MAIILSMEWEPLQVQHLANKSHQKKSIIERNVIFDNPGLFPVHTICIRTDHPGIGDFNGHNTLIRISTFHIVFIFLTDVRDGFERVIRVSICT
jgi:hypothetical protein